MRQKNKGFTLIELLAVIVILAIIALIATPIVINIIGDTKNSATLRSAEFYLDAVELAIPRYITKGGLLKTGAYNILENGNLCLETYDSLTNDCIDGEDEGTDISILQVDVSGSKPTSGQITITGTKITSLSLNLDGKSIIKDEDGKLVYGSTSNEPTDEPTVLKTLDTLCKQVSNGVSEKTEGASYKCKVKETMEDKYKDGYTFYVLTTPKQEDTTINLIMDQNINSDGTPAGFTAKKESDYPTKYNLVAWISDSDYGCEDIECAKSDKGPITAMEFLYNATKDWTNVEPLNYSYFDQTSQNSTKADRCYTSFISESGVATITSLSGDGVIIGTSDLPLRARMPIYTNDQNAELADQSVKEYLYSYLKIGTSNTIGYWSLSSSTSRNNYAWDLSVSNISNRVGPYGVYYDWRGVRPVINLKL